MTVHGAVVVVTGASRGIGRATAELLTARGATVVGVGRDAAAMEAVERSVAGSFVIADVRDPASAERIVAHALSTHGRLDAVVANAGIGYAGAFTDMSAAQIGDLVDVNLTGALLLARAGVPALRVAPRGHCRGIVLVGSIAGAVGVPGETVYSVTKAALEAFATVLREELRPEGISVSVVVPGVVDTDFLRRRRTPYRRRFPRPVPPQRVAAAIVAALEAGADRRFVPRWLAMPARLAALAPRLYRRLARRFG